jgi:hypothetical protein
MLLDKTLKENDVVSIKLTSGEEVIAKYISEDEKVYNLFRPVVLAQGPQGVQLAPYVMTADKNEHMSFLKTAVVTAPAKTQPNVANSYLELTSGIKKATAMPDAPPGLVV